MIPCIFQNTVSNTFPALGVNVIVVVVVLGAMDVSTPTLRTAVLCLHLSPVAIRAKPYHSLMSKAGDEWPKFFLCCSDNSFSIYQFLSFQKPGCPWMVTHQTHESSYSLPSVAAVSHIDLYTVAYTPVAGKRPEMDNEYSHVMQ
jgi:hypothetical protein